jgi:deoxyribose-phosphate aldolase
MNSSLKVEQALLDPFATSAVLQQLGSQALQGDSLSGLAVYSSRIQELCALLDESPIRAACLVGFPFGASDKDVKRFETEVAVDCGAHEINLMPSLALLKEGAYSQVLREIRDVVEAADERAIKIFIEPNQLTSRELEETVAMILDSGAQFIATSLARNSALLDEVRRLREIAGPGFGIMAVAPDERFDAKLLESAGANRILIAPPVAHAAPGEQSFGM